MKLFTPLSADHADQAERGALRGDLVWFDKPEAAKASEDAVWMSIEVPDNRMARFEKRLGPQVGHREFLLPSRITNLHKVQRIQPPL
jgi:hypothetical protein